MLVLNGEQKRVERKLKKIFSRADFICGNMDPDTPPPRNLGQEYRDTLQAQIDMAPQLYASEAMYQPLYAGLRTQNLSAMMPGIMEYAGGMTPIQQRVLGDLQGELDRGGYLTPDEQRRIEQDTRAAFADRGMGRSDAAVFSEAMNLEGARRNRLRDTQRFALGADQNNLSNIYQLLGYGPGRQFNPESGYAQDLYNTNYNAQAAANIAGANNQAAMMGGIMNLAGQGMQAGGSLGAAALPLMFCWVAREVYGADNMKWKLFRAWLLSDAPRWFRGLYVAYGPDFARWIRNKPRVKRLVRAWMDRKIKHVKSVRVPKVYRELIKEL